MANRLTRFCYMPSCFSFHFYVQANCSHPRCPPLKCKPISYKLQGLPNQSCSLSQTLQVNQPSHSLVAHGDVLATKDTIVLSTSSDLKIIDSPKSLYSDHNHQFAPLQSLLTQLGIVRHHSITVTHITIIIYAPIRHPHLPRWMK